MAYARERWRVVFYKRHREDDPRETRPGREYLLKCPKKVAADLFATLDAVAEAPPPQFTGGGKWEAMHGEMGGYYEARKRSQRHLYRLFCLLDRDVEGLAGPSIVVIAGLTKLVGTAFTPAEYESVRRLGDEYLRRMPRSVA